MTTTAWADLPNAVHIDRVIDSAKANPEQWKGADYISWQSRPRPWPEAYEAVKKQGRSEIWVSAWWQTVYNETGVVAWDSMNDTLLALVAYDDCAHMLDSEPGELAILAKFGDPRAILLLPACKVFHSPKEIV